MAANRFPDDFLWGAATSAFQIEGSPLADGAGPSDWLRFTHQSSRVADGSNADVACDHYRKFVDDIELMSSIGLNSYRFSVSWSRIFPYGKGQLNPRGLDFYDRLIDLLLKKDIKPFITLHHWDLPAFLSDIGGWANRDSAAWFGDYAATLFKAFSGRVLHWTTLNEPWVIVDSGYIRGVHPPGKIDFREGVQAIHNLLRAHAVATRAFRSQPSGQIGIVVNLEPKDSATKERLDLEATIKAEAYMNRLFLDPLFFGNYPREMEKIFGKAWPRFSDSDMASIKQPIDFLGINYYTRSVNRFDPSAEPVLVSTVRNENAEYTDMGWEIFPEGLTRVLKWVGTQYGDVPVYITENGAAFDDSPDRLNDTARVEYLRQHLAAAYNALQNGVPLRGYFVWSLFDNFEWSYGFKKRFGLVAIDLTSQQRTPKLSARFYREVIAGQGSAIFL
jgi:beta-glucosidase